MTEPTPESSTPAPLVAAPGAVLSASADSFAHEVQSYRGRVDATMKVDGSHLGMQADFAFRAPDTMHMTMAFSAEDTVLDEIEALVVLPDYYVRIPDEGWYVLTSEALGLDLDALQQYWDNRGLVDYRELTEELEGLAQLADETIDSVDYLHYRGTVDLADLVEDMPEEVFDPGVLEVAQEILEPISVELWLHKETYLPHELNLKMAGTVEGSSFSMDMSMVFFDYNRPVTLPERPSEARPWRDLQLVRAPCTGAELTACLDAQSELQSISSPHCDGSGKRICLVPLGQVQPNLIQHLVDHYGDQYGLTITVLSPSAVPTDMVDPLREQVDAPTLTDYMGSLFPNAYRDPNVVLIGLTPVDLYNEDSHFRYVFGVKGTATHPRAIISTFRMNPVTYGEPPNDELLFSRTRKLASKYIGLLFYGLPSSPDPRSPLYDSILGPADLDNMEEPLLVPQVP